MDLQRLVSEVANSPCLLEPAAKAFEAASQVGEVHTEKDIDALVFMIVNGNQNTFSGNIRINMDRATSHFNVTRPYVNPNEEDYFV